VITLLKGGANPNAKTLAGFTPLHLAVLNRHRNTVRTLLAKSIVPLDLYSDSVHGTPLEIARDAEICEMLEEYLMNGFLKSESENAIPPMPTPKSKRSMKQPSLTRELSDQLSASFGAGAVVPTPKSGRILLEPLLTRDFSGSAKVALTDLCTSNSMSDSGKKSDLIQLKAIERQLNAC